LNRKALHQLSYGLYIVCSKKDDHYNGQIANVVFQATSDPATIVICINKQNLTHEFMQTSRVFTVSILEQDTPLKFIGDFGFKHGSDFDKFAGIHYRIGQTGTPVVLDHATAFIDCRIIGILDAGTHTIFLGEVVDAEILKDTEPMTYEYYRSIRGGGTPKTAPTYIQGNFKEETRMQKYKCSVCGYIYDSEKGDPDSGIKPGTPFEQLPDDWVCPVCGAQKSLFEKMD
jgi:flavin reductase (DIM6/NTAB) family NADH-FMN oxidoreductase RutF/rubredoxin